MKVNRKELIEALEICKPALANNRADELTHFWFGDKQVSAYNGHMTIAAIDIDLDLRGGVPITFLNWLQKTSSDTVDLSMSGTALRAVAGRSHAGFVTLDPERRIAPLYKLSTEYLPISQELVQGLARVIVSHDAKSTVPAKLGVFIKTTNYNTVELYATDDVTLSAMVVPLPDHWPDFPFIVVPIPFIKQIFQHMPMGGRLYLSPNTISLQTRKLIVTSSLIDAKMPNFLGIVQSFDSAEPISIPTGFEEALDRVRLIDARVQVTIHKDVLYLIATDKKNRIEEEFALENSGHPDIIQTFDPKFLKRALEGRTHMNLAPSGIRLIGPPDFIHLIAGTAGE